MGGWIEDRSEIFGGSTKTPHRDLGPHNNISSQQWRTSALQWILNSIGSIIKWSIFHMWQLAKIMPRVKRKHFETIIHGLVTTRLDYCTQVRWSDCSLLKPKTSSRIRGDWALSDVGFWLWEDLPPPLSLSLSLQIGSYTDSLLKAHLSSLDFFSWKISSISLIIIPLFKTLYRMKQKQIFGHWTGIPIFICRL